MNIVNIQNNIPCCMPAHIIFVVMRSTWSIAHGVFAKSLRKKFFSATDKPSHSGRGERRRVCHLHGCSFSIATYSKIDSSSINRFLTNSSRLFSFIISQVQKKKKWSHGRFYFIKWNPLRYKQNSAVRNKIVAFFRQQQYDAMSCEAKFLAHPKFLYYSPDTVVYTFNDQSPLGDHIPSSRHPFAVRTSVLVNTKVIAYVPCFYRVRPVNTRQNIEKLSMTVDPNIGLSVTCCP